MRQFSQTGSAMIDSAMAGAVANPTTLMQAAAAMPAGPLGAGSAFGGTQPAVATPAPAWSSPAPAQSLSPSWFAANPPERRVAAQGPAPQPAPAGSFGRPTGTIPIGNITGGGDWENVNQWDQQILQSSERHGVDPAMLKAMMIVESGGVANAADPNGAIGLMQVKPAYWQGEASQLGYDLYTPEGQIGMAAAIIGGDVAATRGMDPKTAFLSVYYPTPGLDVPGESGDTPRMYLEDMDMYMGIIRAAGQGMSPAVRNDGPGRLRPTPDGAGPPRPAQGFTMPAAVPDPMYGSAPGMTPVAEGGPSPQLLKAVVPNGGTLIGGFKEPTDLGYYDYFEGAGGRSNQHTGIDIGGTVGDPVRSLSEGTVVCAGTGNGPGVNGQGCAAFEDVVYGGAGRVEVQVGANQSIIYGHANASALGVGAQVNPGDVVATVGGFNSDHTHLEYRVHCANGSYLIVDPALGAAGYYDSYRC